MARKSVIQRNIRRQKSAEINYKRREELRERVKKGDMEAQIALNKMKRDSSQSRVRNRDMIDGRPRAYMRRFGVSRINFRRKATKGEIPGIKKASW